MFSNGFTGWHLVIILVIVLLLFGATRLPALARSLGQSMNAFKSEMKPKDDETVKRDAAPSSDPDDPIDKATKQ
ncbi:MAG: tatA [Glaciihabitans sp.]|jgi:sec-independent protein translocase protein TatA|nr:tatA [Glaciihabitans sp.]MDQ1570848.1 sec-independent protein translocase protein TatA [Actinomycetota bacterium]